MNGERCLRWTCTAVLLVALLCAGCACPPDEQAEPTATTVSAHPEEPTAPPTQEEGILRYVDDLSGYAFEYPEEWGVVAPAWPLFARSYDDFVSGRGPFLVVGSFPQDGQLADFGGTLQDMVDQTLDLYEDWDLLSDCEAGEPEPWTFGDAQGARSEGSCENLDTRLLVGAGVFDDRVGLVIAKAPSESWTEHKPTLERMFTSVQFFPKRASGSTILGLIRSGETVRGVLFSEIWQFQVEEGDQVTLRVVPFNAVELGTYESGMVPNLDLFCFGGPVGGESYHTENGTSVPPEQVDFSGVYGMTLHYSAQKDGDCYVWVSGVTGGNYELSLQIED